MEITTDIYLRGEDWDKAITTLAPLFPTRTQYSLYILALSIGIMYDKRIEKPYGEGEHSIGRNVIVNNDNGRLDYMYQASVLSTTTQDLSEDERLNLAFGDQPGKEKVDYLTEFANYGVTKLLELIGDTNIETMEKINNFLLTCVEGRNLELETIPDEILLESFDDE